MIVTKRLFHMFMVLVMLSSLASVGAFPSQMSPPDGVSAFATSTIDTTAPTAPTNVSASNIKPFSLTLSWTASSDNIGVTAYEVYVGDKSVATLTGNGANLPPTTFTVTGLNAGTSYSITLKAKDAAGNVSAASTAVSATTPTKTTLNVGDYIIFGKYYDAPILWRVISKDTAGNPLLLSDRILTLKAFDSQGNFHTGNTERVSWGSNYYPDSNIRQWLNSTSANTQASPIDWVQNDPTGTHSTYPGNSYKSEKGFLADGNFTSSERGLIKSLTHKTVIAEVDAAKKDGGTAVHTYNTGISTIMQNYDTAAYFKNVTDNVFLISAKQLKELVYDNRGVLGNDYILAKPTPQAVTNNTADVQFSSSNNWNYWLNSARGEFSTSVRYINTSGDIISFGGANSTIGVRPATQLNTSAIIKPFGGEGTVNAPYTVDLVAPTTPAGVTALSTTGTSITLGWGASTDNFGVTAYEIWRGSTVQTLQATVVGNQGNPPPTTFQVNELTPGTTYIFSVKARDGAGNLSGSTSQISVKTKSAPTDIRLNASSIAENNAVDAVIGPLSAVDVDAGDSFTYSLVAGAGDTDNQLFNISGTSLRASVSLNFEIKSSYSVRVRVTDSAGLTYEEAMTITVTNVNEAATSIALSPSSIQENNAANAVVGTLTNNDPDASQTRTYTLIAGDGSADNATFNISGSSLRVTAANALNFENKANYTVRVQVSDGTLTYQQTLYITVTNVNESATSITLSNSTIAENSQVDAVVGILANNDPDAEQSFTYTLVAGTGDTDNTAFFIDANASLRVSNPLNYETKSSYSVRIQVSDGTLTYAQTFTITVTDVNEAPSSITLSPSSIPENNMANAVVGQLGHNDPDIGQTMTFSLVAGQGDADNAAFNINLNQLRVTAANALNFETKNNYAVRVQVSDGSLTHTQPLAITVTNVNEKSNDVFLNPGTIIENNQPGAIIGQLGHNDPDANQSMSYTIVAGAGDTDNTSFTIASNLLAITPSANFEVKQSYSIRVQVSDGSLTTQRVFIIPVINVNETVTVTYDAQQGTVNPATQTKLEGAPFGASANANAENPMPIPTRSGYTFGGWYTAVNGGGNLIQNSTTVANGQPITLYAKWTLSNVDPTAPSAPTNLTASNVTTTSVTLTWTAATDNVAVTGYDVFQGDTQIGTVTGTTFQATELEADTEYTFTVKARDAVGNVSEASNEATATTLSSSSASTDIELSSTTINENNVVNAVVGTLTAVDDDEGETFVYTLVSGDGDTNNDSFNIDGDDLRANSAFDFETESTYSVRIRVTDSAGQIYEDTFEITVSDVNEAPTSINISNNSVDENYWLGYSIGALLTTDPDADNTFTYTLVEGAGDDHNDYFSIDSGVLKVAAELEYIDVEDFDYSIRVRSTDQDGLSYEQSLFIEVTQANVVLNVTYNKATVYFQEKLFNNRETLDLLKNYIKINKDAANSDEYEDLASGDKPDTVKISGQTLVISFGTPLPVGKYRLKILANALKDVYNNRSLEMFTSPFYVDGTGPVVSRVKVSKNKKIVWLVFNKKIVNGAEGATNAARAAAFKAAFTLTRNSNAETPTYSPLATKDKLTVSGRTVTLTLDTALTSSNNKLLVQAGVIKDIGGNPSLQLNPSVQLDTTGPTISRVILTGKNKVITIRFKDGAILAYTGSTRFAQLKSAITISTDGTNYSPLGETETAVLDIKSVNGQLKITLNTALSGSQNYVRIAADALKDSFGNKNTLLTTSNIVADEIGPTLITGPLQTVVKEVLTKHVIVVSFNERVFNASESTKASEKQAAILNALEYTLDADAATPVYIKFKATDKITFRRKQLQITLSTKLPTNKKFILKATAGAITDLAGNPTLALETNKFEVDKSGPKLI